jgi:hypothetical protein
MWYEKKVEIQKVVYKMNYIFKNGSNDSFDCIFLHLKLTFNKQSARAA